MVSRKDLTLTRFSNQHGEPTLAYKQSEFGNCDLQTLIAYMVTEYSDSINSGKFSRNSSAFGGWEPFTAADESFIEKALR